MTKRILLVEDNPIEAHEISFFIRNAGFDIVVTNDAESGIEKLTSGDFELLLCDLHLPGENGFDLCRRVKQHDELRRVPVVLLTRYSDPLNFLRGLEVGADGFISKGLSPANIVERLKRVLSLQQTSANNCSNGRNRVVFLETEFEVNAERSQLLKVLLSGFEDVVHLNEKYEEEVQTRVRAQKSLHETNAQLQALNATLEQRVAQRTQELQAYARKLEKKNEELDQFVYVASHDLQEPVRKLISFSQLLQQDVDEELNERATSDLHYITDSARRMQKLVQDLLALSRAGRSAMQREVVHLDDCVDLALETLSMRIDESGAEITRDPLPQVEGDRTTLTQLYLNLIGNSLKFACGNRPLLIQLTAEQDGDAWILGVKDNGIGIEPKYADQIFAPFQRLHGHDQYDGTGIGLAICRTTVERHEGRIWVEPRSGKGSHFSFTLPVHRSDSSSADEPQGEVAEAAC